MNIKVTKTIRQFATGVLRQSVHNRYSLLLLLFALMAGQSLYAHDFEVDGIYYGNKKIEVVNPVVGDVNADGSVGIGDIVAVTNVMAGITTDAATKSRADVNGDGSVGIGDIVAITNIMAGIVVYADLALESTAPISLKVGQLTSVNIISGSGSYTATSSNANVVTADISDWTSVTTQEKGKCVNIKATGVGTASVSVSDSKSGQNVTISVTVTAPAPPAGVKAVDLGLPSGTLWANMNVGATSLQENGLYFAWGETTGYTGDASDGRSFDWASYKWMTPGQASPLYITKYQIANGNTNACWYQFNWDILDYEFIGDALTELLPEDDAAHANWGGEWYMPTEEDFQELNDNTTFEWITVGNVSGGKFTSKVNGNVIFLPAAGLSVNGVLNDVGKCGYFWSSTLNGSNTNFATSLYFNSGNAYWRSNFRYRGYTVRPVLPGKHTPDNVEAVDLGLPSGTKWANMNIGASSPEDYGDYFAWGETEPKDTYSWDTYTHCDGSRETCHDIGTDIAGTEYDAATAQWGKFWHMPTLDQIKELVNNCNHEWTTENGILGRKFTSKINGKTIFLPAAGYRWGGELRRAGSYGYYWSSTPLDENLGYFLGFDSSRAYSYYDDYRYYGFTVRPVR
ncbi:MAG: hypothetical protein II949_11250 [Prevotella sp.]|nr:hypothetical protein [Prevotella sp.]